MLLDSDATAVMISLTVVFNNRFKIWKALFRESCKSVKQHFVWPFFFVYDWYSVLIKAHSNNNDQKPAACLLFYTISQENAENIETKGVEMVGLDVRDYSKGLREWKLLRQGWGPKLVGTLTNILLKSNVKKSIRMIKTRQEIGKVLQQNNGKNLW